VSDFEDGVELAVLIAEHPELDADVMQATLWALWFGPDEEERLDPDTMTDYEAATQPYPEDERHADRILTAWFAAGSWADFEHRDPSPFADKMFANTVRLIRNDEGEAFAMLPVKVLFAVLSRLETIYALSERAEMRREGVNTLIDWHTRHVVWRESMDTARRWWFEHLGRGHSDDS
jgi:hypothetical protein